MRKNDENRFPVLRLMMRLYKIAAYILGGLYALAVAFTVIDSGLMAGILLAVIGFFVFVAIYASGEVIEVFLSIEESGRTLVSLQKRLIQMKVHDYNRKQD